MKSSRELPVFQSRGIVCMDWARSFWFLKVSILSVGGGQKGYDPPMIFIFGIDPCGGSFCIGKAESMRFLRAFSGCNWPAGLQASHVLNFLPGTCGGSLCADEAAGLCPRDPKTKWGASNVTHP